MTVRRWLLQITLTVLWLYLMVGIAWYSGQLQPWVYRWLGS